jgi:hypothetical protein
MYVFIPEGVYLYLPKTHELSPVNEGNYRKTVADIQASIADAPFILVYISDLSRFGSSEFDEDKLFYAAAHTGLISQNVNLYAASVNLPIVTRRFMNDDD